MGFNSFFRSSRLCECSVLLFFSTGTLSACTFARMTGLVVLDGNGVVGGGKVSDIFLSRACVRRLFFFRSF